jgi:diguanylate cyclase (GGDEF)-like protein/PAS domain S-box-containing protein
LSGVTAPYRVPDADGQGMIPAPDPPIALDPLATSTGGAWSRASLVRLVADRTVLMRNRINENVPLPAWLADAVGEMPVAGSGWADGVNTIHPLDRAGVAGAWWDALLRPGRAVHCTFRGRVGEELHTHEDIFIDLTGHDDLAVVILRQDLGPADGMEQWAELESIFTFESTPVTLQYFDGIGTTLGVEGRVLEIFGRTAEEMIGRPGIECIDPAHHDAVVTLWTNVITAPGRTQAIQMEILRPDGTKIWVETTIINRLADDRLGSMIGLTHEITDQLNAEQVRRDHDDDLARSHAELRESHEQLRRSHEDFETLADQVPAAVFRAGPDGTITFANRQWRRLIGQGDAANLRDVIAVDDLPTLDEVLSGVTAADGPREAAVELRSRDLARVFGLSCQAVGHDAPRPIIGSMTDVTSTTELRHLAEHDDLTGLLNRHGIERCLAEALAEDPADVLVAFIDLDGFKAVNDGHGHDSGDEVLRQMGARLRDAVRPSDDVARYGGDEFVILCRQASAGAEPAVTERVERILVEPIGFTGGRWQPAASIGMTRATVDDDTSSLLRRADHAMYDVKRSHQAERSGG